MISILESFGTEDDILSNRQVTIDTVKHIYLQIAIFIEKDK